MTTLHTPRLRLRPFQDIDTPALFDFMRSNSAMQYTYVAPTIECLHHRLRTYEALRHSHGYAPWVVIELASSKIIGWGGLSVDPDAPGWGLEVSYAFSPSSWGSGYATELVQLSLDTAFNKLSEPEVNAFARTENLASIRVLEKCGFKCMGYEPALERNHYLIRPLVSSPLNES